MKSNKLVNKLNQNLADVEVLYVKLHNYHWNVKGPQFFEVHKATEGYYEYFAEKYDEIAERILQIGGKPLTTMKAYIEKSRIKELSKNNFNTQEVVKGVLNDFEYLVKEFKKTSDLASITKDNTTVNLADDTIQWLEKAVWMLDATQK